jgi:predicted metal-dependent hydrolase
MKIIWKVFKKNYRKIYRRKRRKNSAKSKKEYLENKEKAKEVVLEKLKYWQDFYKNNFQINLEYKKVFIKNVSTRWGSCSSKKNLNFSYKIVFLSSELQDYLIVHELCHLMEMNHGENFWKLVSLGVENCSEKRNILRKWNMQER